MPDPASLNVSVGFTGLDNDEATCIVSNLPAGCTARIDVTKPGVGSKRFAISAEGLSLKGAKDVVTAAFLFSERRSNADDAATVQTRQTVKGTDLCPTCHSYVPRISTCTDLWHQEAPSA